MIWIITTYKAIITNVITVICTIYIYKMAILIATIFNC